jgi:hypothetical protein
MIFGSTRDRRGIRRCVRAVARFLALAVCALPLAVAALPARLVLALDGVAYRDMRNLQAGISRTNGWGRVRQFRAFTAGEGYFPVSRMISTFPSCSDVAWTDIFGNRPLAGYQRTYFSAAANSLIELNGVTSTVEHERQMDFQVQNGFLRSMGYLYPEHTFRYEMHRLTAEFWRSPRAGGDFYIYSRASDDAQHLDCDIIPMLCELDRRLEKMRADYRARAGRDLEIVIVSDHGHNHAGRGIRVQDVAFLEQAGYHVTTAINGPKDVVLPVVGVESWVEVHCQPDTAEPLAQQLCRLPGVDVLVAAVPHEASRFLVMNAAGERADILWRPADNAFRYLPVSGDPLHYSDVTAALARDHQLDADGFAGADAWSTATMTNHYPLALERIVRGLTRATLNPATILISLDNRYVNDVWWTEKGSRLVSCRSTHGGLDDLCSDGIVLSNFTPTQDTASDRVAAQFGDFPGVRDHRAEESGAELLVKYEQSLVRIPREPLDREYDQLPEGLCLRVWSPQLTALDRQTPLAAAIERVPRYSTSPAPLRLVLERPLALAENRNERIYALPRTDLAPQAEYRLRVSLPRPAGAGRLCEFNFRTDAAGRPVPY